MNDRLIVANCSGFYGDRLSAARDMVEGGPIDVLTGDYLAELTMAILFRKTLKNPDAGYASSFLTQMEQVMGTCLARGIKVVSNAGGLSPKGLAKALSALAEKLGLHPTIAWIDGDNLLPVLPELRAAGERFDHLDTGRPLIDTEGMLVTANAYLGGWGITKALQEGADIVVGGRIADACLVSGPAAWKFGWNETDWDKLAGAVAAGHIIECGTHATGGNYAFMDDVPSFKNMGFPMAEIEADGSFVITKHPGTGGLVDCGTVTSQLLYEVRSPDYMTPDVVARFDTLRLEKEGTDRVRVSGTKGRAPTSTLKVCMNRVTGHRNAIRAIITGLDVKQKAKRVETMMFEALGGRDVFDEIRVRFHGHARTAPKTLEESHSLLQIAVRGKDTELIGKRFPQVAVELALASIPGYTLAELPGKGAPVIQHWPALVPKSRVQARVMINGQERIVGWHPEQDDTERSIVETAVSHGSIETTDNSIRIPLGHILGARSGDKGGNANLGIWVRHPGAYDYFSRYLTVKTLKKLLPDMKPFEIERHDFPNLYAMNFYIKGVLGDGVASSLLCDPQAKTLGEYVRCIKVDMPVEIAESVWNERE